MTPPAPSRRPRRRALRRTAAIAVAAVGAAFALSGCVALKSLDLVQEGEIGPIDVVMKGCGSTNTAPTCKLGNTNLESNNSGTGQVLIGLQVNAGVTAPNTFTSNFPDSQPYTLSPSYTAELTRLRPPDPGSKWVGYISDARTYTPGKDVTVRIPMVRALQPDGSPPTGTGFGATWVLGSRGVTPDLPANRPVTCGTTTTTVSGDFTICEDGTGGGGGSPFNEFAFLTPAPVNVQPGATATIPFTGKLSGPASPAITFALAATTTVPGGVALTNVPTLAPPGDSSTTVVMTVSVPAGTRPGTYEATLTGTLGTGESRSAKATIVVTGSGGTTAGGPALSGLTLSRQSISNRRRKPPSLITASLSQPASVTMLLERRATGRKKNGVCVAPTRALIRARATACFRFVRVSSSRKPNQGAGPVSFSVSGRAAGLPRPAGTYRVSLTATAGGIAGLPVRAALRITG